MLKLESYYSSIQDQFAVTSSGQYSGLVIPNGNSAEPVHRWFHLKEAYSCQLLRQVLYDTRPGLGQSLRVLDPYSGVGTTTTSVAQLVAAGVVPKGAAYGLECNPFLHLVAATKLDAMRCPPGRFLRLARKLAATVVGSHEDSPEPPSLSTFSKEGYFDPHDLRRLLLLRVAIDYEEDRGADPVEVALARVCLGSVVEAVSNLRRDGRALRHVAKQTKPKAVQAFLDRAEQIAADLPTRPLSLCGEILHGDGRTLESLDLNLQFDLALFSPPYPNNIDYTEVYKLENWLLGFIDCPEDFAQLRRRTVYSHPSLLRTEPLPNAALNAKENAVVEQSVAPLVDAIPDDRYAKGRSRMFRGYALDMYVTLRSIATRMKPGGKVVYVVGNSVHGRPPAELVVAADLIIAVLACAAGYTVDRFEIARRPPRRGNQSQFARESVVFLRLPS
jgi:hypothetical protein